MSPRSDRATKANRFCRKPYKENPTRYRVMPVESQIGHFSEMKDLCNYK